MKKKILEQNKKNNGITLIALVITIIVLLILAGVSIATLTGNNGILTKAGEAKEKTELAKEEELEILDDMDAMIDSGKIVRLEVTPPTRTTFKIGEEIDTAGMVITAVYNDNTTKDITDKVTITGYDKTKEGEQTVVVTYGNQTATFTVTVLYEVTIDGEHFTYGEYNKKITVTAETEKDGKPFSGCKIGDIVVSTDETYTFYIGNNTELTKVYGETLELVPAAMLTDIHIINKDYSTGKASMRVVGHIVEPEGYKLEQAGLIFTTKTEEEVPILHDEIGNPMEGARKNESSVINTIGQFSMNLNNCPEGGTARFVVFASLTKGNEKIWVFSEEKSMTNN